MDHAFKVVNNISPSWNIGCWLYSGQFRALKVFIHAVRQNFVQKQIIIRRLNSKGWFTTNHHFGWIAWKQARNFVSQNSSKNDADDVRWNLVNRGCLANILVISENWTRYIWDNGYYSFKLLKYSTFIDSSYIVQQDKILVYLAILVFNFTDVQCIHLRYFLSYCVSKCKIYVLKI